jgi:hypothetical protein
MHHAPAATLPPVAVGGIGGSGTRIVARLLQTAGVHLGDDLNGSVDTLWFTLLFKRFEVLECDDNQFDQLVQALCAGLRRGAPLFPALESLLLDLSRDDRPNHPAAWLRDRALSLRAASVLPAREGRWGWKEPNTHIVIERLWQRLPDLRYVHVVRNGMDMAFSSNQNQLQLWGPRVLGESGPVTPARSLAYWCRVHQHIRRLLESNPSRMYWLDYDALCRSPRTEAAKLCDFLELSIDAMVPLLGEVHEPARRTPADIGMFAPTDLDYVRSLGYDVAPSAHDVVGSETS